MASNYDTRFPGYVELFDITGKPTYGYRDQLALNFDPMLGLRIPRLEPAPSGQYFDWGRGPHISLALVSAFLVNKLIGTVNKPLDGQMSSEASIRMMGEHLGSIDLVLGLAARDDLPHSQRIVDINLTVAQLKTCINVFVVAQLAEPDIRFLSHYKSSEKLKIKFSIENSYRSQLGLTPPFIE